MSEKIIIILKSLKPRSILLGIICIHITCLYLCLCMYLCVCACVCVCKHLCVCVYECKHVTIHKIMCRVMPLYSLHPDLNVPDTGFTEELAKSLNSVFVKPSSLPYGTR